MFVATLLLATLHAQVIAPDSQTTLSAVDGPRGATAVVERRLDKARLSARLRANQARRSSVTRNTASSGADVIETLAGVAPFQAQPQPALSAGLGSITGIATDTYGNTFVAAEDFRSVLKIDGSGNVTVYAGQPLASGPLQASGDGGLATAATLVSPLGLAVDSAGNLYIADAGSFTVRVVAASTGIITTVVGIAGQHGLSVSGTLAVNALLDDPTSVAVDAGGNLFLVNGGPIWRVDHGTGILSQYSGTSPICSTLSNTATCPISTLNVVANPWPGTIAISNGNLYIAAFYMYLDYGTFYTGSIVSVQLSTGTAQLLAGGGFEAPSVPGNTAIGAYIDPLSVVADASGNVDFTEGYGEETYGASTIMQLPVNGTSMTTIAGTGQFGSSGDGGPATAAQIQFALSLTMTASGNLLFTEPSRVRLINTGGVISTFAGTGQANYSGDSGPAQMAGISNAQDAIADAQGNLYVADGGNGVVRRIDASTGIITTIAGNGDFADPQQGTSLPGDGGPATQAALGAPVALAMGAGGSLFIGDFYQGVRVVNLNTGTITTLNSQMNVLSTIVFDNQHTLYATNNEQIEAVDTTSGVSTVVAGNGSDSGSGDTGDGGPATKAYIFPTGLALDNAGNLYIADGYENGIRIVNLSTGVINAYAGGYANETDPGDKFGYSGDGGPASNATFSTVRGLHSDGMGNLLIADSGNGAIRKINLSSGVINTVAGDGSLGYSGDGASATAATLSNPYASSTDAAGNLYVADFSNDRIRRVVANPVALTAALAASATSVSVDESVTLTATFSGISFGIAPTGGVTFYDGTTSMGSGTLEPSPNIAGAYVATLTTSTLAVGSHSITAQLGVDTNYSAATSTAVTVVVAPAAPAVTLSATALTFAAQNVGSTGGAQTVTLTNPGTAGLTIASIAASGDFAQTNNCGSSVAAGGACMISVTFTPTTSGARSGVLTINDNATPATQTVSLSGPGATVSVVSSSAGLTVTSIGGTATAPIQVAPVSGFTGTVSLTCTVSYLGTGTANDPPTCSLNPTSAQLTGGSSGTSTLTISTTAATASTAKMSERADSAVAFAALLFLGFLPRRRWRERILMIVLCLVASGCVLGCGSGSGGGSSTPGNPGTTAGSYQVVVTATSGTVTETVTLPVMVQ